MKKLFVAALAIASVVACSKDETVDKVLSPAIGFEQAFVDNATRAAADPSTTAANITAFDVWGLLKNSAGAYGEVFDAQRVTGSNASGTWTYSPLQYWIPGNSYKFAAVSPVDHANVVVTKAQDADFFNDGIGTIAFENIDGTDDLLYATQIAGSVAKDFADKVQFTFNHLLSKVKFTFKNGFAADNYTIKVSNVVMSAPKKASIDLTDAAANWSWADYAESVNLDFGDVNGGSAIASGLKAECADERLTIPAPSTQTYVVTFDVELYSGAALAHTASLQTEISNVALQIGYAYNFIATLNQSNINGEDALEPIVFDVVEVDEWEQTNDNNFGNHTEVISVSNAAELTTAINEGATNFRLDADVDNTGLTFNAPAPSSTPSGSMHRGTRAGAEQTTFTLDLNGKSINVDGDAIVVDGGVKLVINGNGDVKASENNDTSANAVWVKWGNVVINGGNYYVGQDNAQRNDCIYVGASAYKDEAAQKVSTLSIYGGTFEAAPSPEPVDNGKCWVLNINDAFAKSGSKINVYGGEFENFNPAAGNTENPEMSFVAEGYISVVTANGYKVVPENTLQEVKDQTELQNALNSGGSNIVLTADIATTSSLFVPAGITATIDLNGKNIINNSNDDELEKGDGIIVYGNLTINGNGTVNGYTRAVWARSTTGAVVTINGGDYVGSNVEDGCEVIYASGNGKINIFGGTFQAAKADTESFAKPQEAVLNVQDNQPADIDVYGGRFKNFDPSNNISENPNENFVADGYEVYKVDANWYAVVKK